ncbi:hypothetical protein D1P53_001522 [Cryptococcus gattii VGV]|nr:hypothetical protein D1P53_001522 [Cryptococcus gattii VGV]
MDETVYLFRPSLRRLIARIRASPQSSITLSSADYETIQYTYRACHAITLTSYYMSHKHPKLMARAWMVWVQTFSAAVSMAALAIWCAPFIEDTKVGEVQGGKTAKMGGKKEEGGGVEFVKGVYEELKEACEMIRENGSKRSQGVLSLLPILLNLVSNRYPQVLGKAPSSARVLVEGEDMLFALLGGHVDGTVTHQYPAPRAEQQQEREQQQQQEREQGSRSRVPSQTPHLSYPQLSTKSQPQSAASQDTPLQTPEQSQVVIPPEQEGVSELHVSQSQTALQVSHQHHEHEHHPGAEMFVSDRQTNNPPVSQSSAWMMPVMDSNNGPIVLPLAPPVPTSTPFDGFVSLPSMDFGNANGVGGVGMTNDLGMMGMSLSGDFACSAPAPVPPATAPVSAAGAGDKGGPMPVPTMPTTTTIMDNPPGLWEKLQAFYEPSVPMFWEGNVGCGDVNPGVPMPSGMGMDGSGMGMGVYGGYAGGAGMNIGEGGYGMGVAIGDGVSGATATGMNGGGFGYPTQGTF